MMERRVRTQLLPYFRACFRATWLLCAPLYARVTTHILYIILSSFICFGEICTQAPGFICLSCFVSPVATPFIGSATQDPLSKRTRFNPSLDARNKVSS